MSEVRECKGRIFDIQKYSIYDGQGIRTLVFLKGCPLRCKWCSNPEGLSKGFQIMFRQDMCNNCGACTMACPQKRHSLVKVGNTFVHKIDRTIPCTGCGECEYSCLQKALSVVGKEMSVARLMKIIEQDSSFYWNSGGGVTFGGGEATMQSEFLLEALKECKKQGIHTALETCGLADWSVMEKLFDYVDLFLYDIKQIDSEQHKKLTGVGNETIRYNLEQLFKRDAHIVIRMPLIKGYNDSYDSLMGAVEYIKTLNKGNNFGGIEILPYHSLGLNKYKQLDLEYGITDNPSYSEEELKKLEEFVGRMPLPIRIIKH